MYFWSPTYGYTEGASGMADSVSVPQRASTFHVWSGTQWTLPTRTGILAQIKSIRNIALAKFVANAGVGGVYDVNYEAAIAYDAGNTTLVLRNGKTSGTHCTEFGTLLGMTAAQFAAYIIAENRQTTPTKRCAVLMHEIEGEYLRLYCSAIAAMTDADAIAAPAAYQAFCDSRNP